MCYIWKTMSNELSQLRRELDEIDERFVDVLAERFVKTRQIGEFKRENGLPPMDPAREQEIFERLEVLATARGVNPELLHELFSTVMTAVKLEHVALGSR